MLGFLLNRHSTFKTGLSPLTHLNELLLIVSRIHLRLYIDGPFKGLFEANVFGQYNRKHHIDVETVIGSIVTP